MLDNKKIGIGLGLSVLFCFAVFVGGSFKSNPEEATDSTSIHYNAEVCVSHIDKDGTLVSSECSHNLLYDSGKTIIKTYLGDTGGTGDEVDQIRLCNATATSSCGTPVAGATEAFNPIETCGLQKTTGTYLSFGDGNWSIYKEFTSTCNDVQTNLTRLENSATTNFSGNTFSLVTLQNGDKLTINWTIGIS